MGEAAVHEIDLSAALPEIVFRPIGGEVALGTIGEEEVSILTFLTPVAKVKIILQRDHGTALAGGLTGGIEIARVMPGGDGR